LLVEVCAFNLGGFNVGQGFKTQFFSRLFYLYLIRTDMKMMLVTYNYSIHVKFYFEDHSL